MNQRVPSSSVNRWRFRSPAHGVIHGLIGACVLWAILYLVFSL